MKKAKKQKPLRDIADDILKSIRHLCRPNRQKNKIKDRILEYTRALYMNDENYYEHVAIKGVFNNNYIGLESNGDRYNG